MTVAVIVDNVDLEFFAGEIIHQLVAAGENSVLVPTDDLRRIAPGWDAGGFAGMMRDPSAPAHLDGMEYSLAIDRVVVLASARWLAAAAGAGETADDSIRVLRSALERNRRVLVVPGWESGDGEAFELARSVAARLPSVEWLDPGTGDRGRTPTVTETEDPFDAVWVERWYWA